MTPPQAFRPSRWAGLARLVLSNVKAEQAELGQVTVTGCIRLQSMSETLRSTLILKFFLHLSKDEQRKRLLERVDMPEKNWKISAADVHERTFWDSYRHAYEKLLTHTSTESAPWYIIPADRKWFTRAAVADIIVTRLKALDLHYPSITAQQRSQLAVERKQLACGSEASSSAPRELVPV